MMKRRIETQAGPVCGRRGGERKPAAEGAPIPAILLVVMAVLLAACGGVVEPREPADGGKAAGEGGGDVAVGEEEAGGEAGEVRSAGERPGDGDGDGDGEGGEVVAGVRPCGPVNPWDRDGDGISDSVEENHRAEGYLPLDPDACDDDPTLPRGTWYEGALEGSLNLTDRGTGYVHNRGSDPVDGDDWGSLSMVHCLEEVGRHWEASGLVMGVNDLSQRPGERFPPHRSHQNGLDADLRYVRTDGINAPLDLRRNPELYDPVATQQLFRLFLEHCDVHVLFVDLEGLGFGNAELDAGREVLHTAAGHSNHFHVRLNPPGGAS